MMQRVEREEIRKRREEFCHTLVGKGKPSIYSGENIKNFAATWEEGNLSSTQPIDVWIGDGGDLNFERGKLLIFEK